MPAEKACVNRESVTGARGVVGVDDVSKVETECCALGLYSASWAAVVVSSEGV